MYPSLRENQAWAQSASEEPLVSRRGSRTTDAYLPMSSSSSSGSRNSPPSTGTSNTTTANTTHNHQSSAALAMAYRRPMSNGYASAYYNAVYYPNYRLHDGHTPAGCIQPHQITHLFYAFAACDFDGTVRLSDDKADSLMDVDGVAGAVQACLALKQHNPNLRVILSIGGPRGSEAFKYVAPNKALRAVFGQSLRSLVTRHGFDGVDIHWETPEDNAQGEALVSLCAAIRGYLPGSFIFVTLPGNPSVLQRIELDQFREYCDFINLKTYDFAHTEPPQSCHHAQLLASTLPGGPANALSCQSAINYLDACSWPLRRVLLGIPCFAKAFVGATGLNQPYREVREIRYSDMPPQSALDHIDNMVGAAHRIEGDTWMSYDLPETVRNKASFVKMRRLAGLFYWEATSDKRGGESLVWTGYDSLRAGG